MGHLFCLDIGSFRSTEVLIDGLPKVSQTGSNFHSQEYAFYQIRKLTMGATVASMVAYLTAQFIDVHIFHF